MRQCDHAWMVAGSLVSSGQRIAGHIGEHLDELRQHESESAHHPTDQRSGRHRLQTVAPHVQQHPQEVTKHDCPTVASRRNHANAAHRFEQIR
jgi:hypothetical protein